MKLSEWAKQQGISYKTAWRWFKSEKLPCHAIQTESGTILVKSVADNTNNSCVIYARVSSHDQKNDLDRQVSRITSEVLKQGLVISKIVTEIGSGLNGPRPKLKKLLSNPSIKIIAIEHQDRLMRRV